MARFFFFFFEGPCIKKWYTIDLDHKRIALLEGMSLSVIICCFLLRSSPGVQNIKTYFGTLTQQQLNKLQISDG